MAPLRLACLIYPPAQISESTTSAEKEKQKVAVIVDSVTKKAGEIASVKDDAER